MFVVYHIESTYILKGKDRKEYYATEAAAKAALTRAIRTKREHLGERVKRKNYAIADAAEFSKSIVKYDERPNLMSGKMVKIARNTPISCDPSSETYWSM